MSKNLLGVLLAAAAILSSCSAATAQDGAVFRYRGTPGDVRYFDTTSLVEIRQNLNGEDSQTAVEMRGVVRREQQAADQNGSIRFRDTQERLQAAITLPRLGEYRFDSRASENATGDNISDALTPLYAALSGAVVDVACSPSGEIRKVTGLREAVQSVLDKHPLAVRFAARAASDEGAKSSYAEQILRFPATALKPGDKWETDLSVTLPQIGKLAGRIHCQYIGVSPDSRLHVFETRNEMKVSIDQVIAGTQIVGTIEVTESKGECQFDAEAGVLVKRESKTTMAGDLVVKSGDKSSVIKQTQTMTFSSKLVDKPPQD